MTFIEVQDTEGERFTVNTEFIVSFSPDGENTTDIQLNSGSPHGRARLRTQMPYDQVRRLVGLDWLTCGENFQGDICDRRLDSNGRCPIHGLVGQ